MFIDFLCLWLPVVFFDELFLPLVDPFLLSLFEGLLLKFTLESRLASLDCVPLFPDPLLVPSRPSNLSIMA